MRVFNVSLSLFLTMVISGCGKSPDSDTPEVGMQEATIAIPADIGKSADALFAAIAAPDAGNEAGNVLLSEYSGPYGGVPHFDAMDLDGIKPALEAAMARNLAEVDAITNNPQPPDFTNTIIALERAGEDLQRVFAYWGIWSSNLSTPEFRAIQQEMAPKLADFNSKITQNEALFQRIRSVYESDEYKRLPAHEQRLVWLTYDGFASNGATLQGEA
ncbi:MAG: hypothetical protein L0Y45_04995, partial [Woeseiaceae bacterium]|nr:hypothetical protein [Woeseiaceae bacterium]